jgi:hypothetical protein
MQENEPMNLKYTGIGSRAAPAPVLAIAQALGWHLAKAGWTLRSGAADGCDRAFEAGAREAGGTLELFLPWNGYNNSTDGTFDIPKSAYDLAASLHPTWTELSQGIQKMHASSCQQTLGHHLDEPSAFSICWTQDGCESERARTRKTGGTATGIVLAERNSIPLFNLCNDNARRRLNAMLQELQIDYQVPLDDAPAEQASLF